MSTRPRRAVAAAALSYDEGSDDDLFDSDLEERAAKVSMTRRRVNLSLDENGVNNGDAVDNSKSMETEPAQNAAARRSVRVRRPPTILEIVSTNKEASKKRPVSEVSSGRSKRQPSVQSKKERSREKASSQRSSSRAVTATQMTKCREILKEIMKSEVFILKSEYDVSGVRWFTDPVDPVELEIPDYLEIIKNPMDLLTVKKYLDEGVYTGPEKFLEHVRLVFSNAVTYNTDPENPVHIVAKKLSEQFEEQVRDMKLHWNARSVVTSYEEPDSDDEDFLLSDESDAEVLPKHRPKASRRSTRCTVRMPVTDSASEPEDDDGSSLVSSSISIEEDEADEVGSRNDDEAVKYRVQYILASESMTQTKWRSLCDKMNTREVTRGSVWKQSDKEYFDSSDETIEKFLVKWMHASFLHLSWEKEEDLLTMVGPSAKAQLRRFRERLTSDEPELFEDLGRGDYFPPAFLEIERVLDVDDPSVTIQSVDYVHAAPDGQADMDIVGSPSSILSGGPILSPFAAPIDVSLVSSCPDTMIPDSVAGQGDDENEINSLDAFEFCIDTASSLLSPGKAAGGSAVEENAAGDFEFDIDADDFSEDVDSIDVRRNKRAALLRSPISKKANDIKKDSKTSPLILHGENCWVTVKWAGLPYEDATFEHLDDLRAAGIEYEVAMRAFYKREQRLPVVAKKSARSRQVKSSLDASLIDTTAPTFAAGSLRDYQWEGVRWLLFNWSQKRNSILAVCNCFHCTKM